MSAKNKPWRGKQKDAEANPFKIIRSKVRVPADFVMGRTKYDRNDEKRALREQLAREQAENAPDDLDGNNE